jgi:hypothetical protein
MQFGIAIVIQLPLYGVAELLELLSCVQGNG